MMYIKKFKAQYPDIVESVSYQELIKKIGESWSAMAPEEKENLTREFREQYEQEEKGVEETIIEVEEERKVSLEDDDKNPNQLDLQIDNLAPF